MQRRMLWAIAPVAGQGFGHNETRQMMSKVIAKTGMLRALGAMSGTSLDGVDVAVVETDGLRIAGFGPSGYQPYSDAERVILRAGLGRWHGAEVEAAAEVVEAKHMAALGGFEDIDLVGFHGQTLAHAPRQQGTLQVGNGAVLAEALKLPVVWDFRSDDVSMGGEGAPLAPFFHFACAKYIKATGPICFLNLGGVGNITYVDPRFDKPEDPGALLAFDTGPANAPINDLLQARLGLAFDKDGGVASSGEVETGALAAKVTGPE
jgi:anhydro-N-acetylmuramic acid kinase